MIQIIIECEDYYVADSLFILSAEIENTDILDKVYNGTETREIEKGTLGQFKATIKRIGEQ